MFSLSLILIFLFSLVKLIFTSQSPFQLTLDYHEKEMIHTNFTITTELQRDLFLPIHCGDNRYRLCLVELSLQIRADSMSIDVWCQPPAFAFANQPLHTCVLPMVNSTQQPSITMIINSHDLGEIFPLVTANFTYSSQYNIKKQGETSITIVESVLSRNVRSLLNDNDDAIESELDDPECIPLIVNYNNGLVNTVVPPADIQTDGSSVAIDFATDVNTDDDSNPPAGEYDDSLAENCAIGQPLYGHPNVEWIRVANAPNLIIDQRINPDNDSDSDGIDFPPMNKYILQIRMKPYVFLQFVTVPASNVVLLYVVVHYDSGKYRPYKSARQSNPIVENFLADEPTRFFEVHLNATDNGLPPDDVTLVVAYCLAPKSRYPVDVRSGDSLDTYADTFDVDLSVDVTENVGAVLDVQVGSSVPAGNIVGTVDVSITADSIQNVASGPDSIGRGLIPMDDTAAMIQPVINNNVQSQVSVNLDAPSNSLIGIVQVSISSPVIDAPPDVRTIDQGLPSQQIFPQVPAFPLDTAIVNQDQPTYIPVPFPAVVSVSPSISSASYSSNIIQPPLPLPMFNSLPPMRAAQVPPQYSCHNNLQIVGNINVQSVFDINNVQQTTIGDNINSQSSSPGYSFSSFHYPYYTIVINLRVNIYVHSFTLGSQTNVERYGLRVYNPLQNVDDTYYSSTVPEYGNEQAIVGIPSVKVAFRLYLNLYTTSDGRPPSNIKIVINACFDVSSPSSDSSPVVDGQNYRSVYLPQQPIYPTGIPEQPIYPIGIPQQPYIDSYAGQVIPLPGVAPTNIVQTVPIPVDTISSNIGPTGYVDPRSVYSNVPAPYTNSYAAPVILMPSFIPTNVVQTVDVPVDTVSSNIGPTGYVDPRSIYSNVPAPYVDIAGSGVPPVDNPYMISLEQTRTPSISSYPCPMLPMSYLSSDSSPVVDGQNYRSVYLPQQPIYPTGIPQQPYIDSYAGQMIPLPGVAPTNIVQIVPIPVDTAPSYIGPTGYVDPRSVYSNVPAPYINSYAAPVILMPSFIPTNVVQTVPIPVDTVSSNIDPTGYVDPRSAYVGVPAPYTDIYTAPVIQMPDIGSSEIAPTVDVSIPSSNRPIPFSRTAGQCFEQILIVGGSHITMIRSRNLRDPMIGPEINFDGSGYTFSSPSDTYEIEIHFAQPFTMKYVYIPYSSNIETFKVDASHAGMLGVFTSKTTKDGLVVDGFPTMLVSMLVISIVHTTDGYLPNHITLSIGLCNPIYSPSNEGNEIPEITDCVSQLRLFGNTKQISRIDIKSPTKNIKATSLINPNQNGMSFPTREIYTIDIILIITMTIESITLNPSSNVDLFSVQLHMSHRYYLEITSVIGSKIISGLENTQANLIRIIIDGTEDGLPPSHISFKIAACIPTRLPKLMRSPFTHEMITKRRKQSKFDKNRPGVLNNELVVTYPDQPLLTQQESFQPVVEVPVPVDLIAPDNVPTRSGIPLQPLPSFPIVQERVPSSRYAQPFNSQPQFIPSEIPNTVVRLPTNVVIQRVQNPTIQIQSSPVITRTSTFPATIFDQPSPLQPYIQRSIFSPMLSQVSSAVPINQQFLPPQIPQPSPPLPSYPAQSPSGYTCSQNYQITTNIHINTIYTLSTSSQSSLIDSASSNSLLSNNGYSFSSHHYPFQTIVISLKFTAYVQSLSLGSQSNVQQYGLRTFHPSHDVDDTYYSSIDPTTGQSIISNIPSAKVAIRLYINLYTTSDGRPPSNIQLNLNICFDLRSSSNGDSRTLAIGTPSVPVGPSLIGQRTIYAPPGPMQELVPTTSPVIVTISSRIIEQPSLINAVSRFSPPIPNQIVQQQPIVPFIPRTVGTVQVPTYIDSTQPQPQVIVRSIPSPIFPQLSVTVQMVESIGAIGTPIVDQSVPIQAQRTVYTPQQPQDQIISPTISVIIQTRSSPILSATPGITRTYPSSVITERVVQGSPSVSAFIPQPSPIQNQRTIVIQLPQQQPAVIRTVFSEIQPAPSMIVPAVYQPVSAPLQRTVIEAQPQQPYYMPQTIDVVINTVSTEIQPIQRTIVNSFPSPIRTAQVPVGINVQTYPSYPITSFDYGPSVQQPTVVERRLPTAVFPSVPSQPIVRQYIPLPQPSPPLASYPAQSPSGYTCSQNYQITTNIHINTIYTLAASSQSSLIDSASSNSLLSNNGYSFSSHHYPFQTIVISLKFTAYVQSLSLGSQSNVQQYGLRTFHPSHDVDDTYYSSIDPTTGQSVISNIPSAKVAIRLYINLYTTSDGRPPSNIQLNLNICFDLRSSSSGDSRTLAIGTPSIPVGPSLIGQRTIYAPPGPTQEVVPTASPVIITISSQIIEQPSLINAVSRFSPPTISQVLRQRPIIPSGTVQIPTFDGAAQLVPQIIVRSIPSPVITQPYISSALMGNQRSVVVQEQQPIYTPSFIQSAGTPSQPSVVINTVFSRVLSSPSGVVRTLYSPTILQPSITLQISQSAPVVEIPAVYQPSLIESQRTIVTEQQPQFPSSTAPVIIRSMFSPTLPTTSEVVRTLYSPTILQPSITLQISQSVPVDEIPTVYQPSPIESQRTIVTQQQPQFPSPTISVIIRSMFSPMLPATSDVVRSYIPPVPVQISEPIESIRTPTIYQPLPIQNQRTIATEEVVSPTVLVTINTQFSPILPSTESISRTLSSPVIEAPIPQATISVSIIEQAIVPQSVPTDSQRAVVIEQQQPIVSPNFVQPLVASSLPSVVIRTTFSKIIPTPSGAVRTLFSPVITSPFITPEISRSVPIMRIPDVYQPSPIESQGTIVTQQQPQFPSSTISVIIRSMFSPTLPATSEVVRTLYSPTIPQPSITLQISQSAPVVEIPAVYQPLPIESQRTIVTQQQPQFSSPTASVIIRSIFSPTLSAPSGIVRTLYSPTIPQPSITLQISQSVPDVEIPTVYQPSPIESQRTIITQQQPQFPSPTISVIIRSVFSPTLPATSGVVRTLYSPTIPQPSITLQISQSAPVDEIPAVYQPLPIESQRTIVTQQQPQFPSPTISVIIRSMFSPMLPATSVTSRTVASPIIDQPSVVQASATISIVENVIDSQPLPSGDEATVVIQVQEPIVGSSAPSVVIRTAFGQILPAPSGVVRTLPLTRIASSPIQPIVYQPSPVVYQPRIFPQQQQPIFPSSDVINILRTVSSPIEKISGPVFNTIQSPSITVQVTMETNENSYSSPSIVYPSYPISIQTEEPYTQTRSSPIISPIVMQRTSILPSSIPISQIRPEICNCQCPMSGLIPIYYNNNQQSCIIATTRKRRDDHLNDNDDDDCSSPID